MEEILDALKAAAKIKPHPIIFLCGLGGTGKTTLAHVLQKRISAVVIETDWYLTYPTEQRRKRIATAMDSCDQARIEQEENPLKWYSWDLFQHDLSCLMRDGTLTIDHAWDQKTGRKDLHVTLHFQTANDFILVDGIYLLHPPISESADLIVLLESDTGLSQKRAMERDAHRSDPVYLQYKMELQNRYDLPYFGRYKSTADIVVRAEEASEWWAPRDSNP